MRSRASRCRSTATARTCATGSMSRTMPRALLLDRRARPRRRELQYRRRRRAHESRRGARDLRAARRACARRASGSRERLITLRRRPARPRPALRHRCAQDPRRTRLAAAGDLRDGLAQDRALVPDNRPWWRAHPQRASIAANAWGPAVDGEHLRYPSAGDSGHEGHHSGRRLGHAALSVTLASASSCCRSTTSR